MISGFPLADTSNTILTPTNLLWLIAAMIAATFVFGSINRRRQRLTDTLREYVEENKTARPLPPGDNRKPTSVKNSP